MELMLCVLVIGVLATLAIPRFTGQRQAANDGLAKTALQDAATSLTQWAKNHEAGAEDTLDLGGFYRLAASASSPDAPSSGPAAVRTSTINKNFKDEFTGGTVPAAGIDSYRIMTRLARNALGVPADAGTCVDAVCDPTLLSICNLSKDAVFCALLDVNSTEPVLRWKTTSAATSLAAAINVVNGRAWSLRAFEMGAGADPGTAPPAGYQAW